MKVRVKLRNPYKGWMSMHNLCDFVSDFETRGSNRGHRT
jgi:hypothetical protein